MAEPNDTTQEQDPTNLSAADRAFLEHMGQGKGKGYAKGWRGETGEPLVNQALELKSIGRRFTTRVLPIMVLPLLLLGGLAIAGLTILGTELNEAVLDTDTVLDEHFSLVQADLEPELDAVSEVVDQFLVNWYNQVSTITNADTSAVAIANTFEGQTNAQVVFVDENGRTLSTTSLTTLDNYSNADWFLRVQDGISSVHLSSTVSSPRTSSLLQRSSSPRPSKTATLCVSVCRSPISKT